MAERAGMLSPSKEMPANPTVFISYSWDDEAHKEWVRQLATKLRHDGVDARLDHWHAVPGDQLPGFMEREIRDNDYVVIVCTHAHRYGHRQGTEDTGRRQRLNQLVRWDCNLLLPKRAKGNIFLNGIGMRFPC